jgi:hypothetical protein
VPKSYVRRSGIGSAPYPLIKIPHSDMAPADWFPDLAKAATVIVTKSGRWSDIFGSTTLSRGDVVLIPADVTVVYDESSQTPIGGLAVKGSLRFATSSNTLLTGGSIMTYPGSRFEMKPSSSVTSVITFSGIVDSARDPSQVLPGFVAIGGAIDIEGTAVANPFARVAPVIEPEKADPSDWRYHGTADRTLLYGETLDIALSDAGYRIDPVRNVVFRSATTTLTERGNMLFTGDTSVTVRDAAFIDLGRTTVKPVDDSTFDAYGAVIHVGTNERGRYALHAHHLERPFVFAQNVIEHSPRWGIVNHASFGSIADNIVIGAAGTGIIGEAGVESGDVSGNLVIGLGGGDGLGDDERFGSSQGTDIAHGGFGYWFRGPFLTVHDNAAIGYFPISAYSYFVHPGFTHNMMTKIPGMPKDLYGKTGPDLISLNPIRLFSRNSAEGYFGNEGFSIFYSQSPQVISGLDLDMRGKSLSTGVFLRHSKQLTVADSHLRSDGAGAALVSSPNPGFVDASNVLVEGFGK